MFMFCLIQALPFLLLHLWYSEVGDSMVAKRVYRECPILFPNRVTLVDMVELDMFDFDIILGMNCLHAFFCFIYCRTRLVKF